MGMRTPSSQSQDLKRLAAYIWSAHIARANRHLSWAGHQLPSNAIAQREGAISTVHQMEFGTTVCGKTNIFGNEP